MCPFHAWAPVGKQTTVINTCIVNHSHSFEWLMMRVIASQLDLESSHLKTSCTRGQYKLIVWNLWILMEITIEIEIRFLCHLTVGWLIQSFITHHCVEKLHCCSLLLLVKRGPPTFSKLAAGDSYFLLHIETARRVLPLSPLLGAKGFDLLSVQILLHQCEWQQQPGHGMSLTVQTECPLGDIR